MGLKTLVIGCGHMGSDHARAYHKLEGFDLIGVASRGGTSRSCLAQELGVKAISSFDEALEYKPDVVSINTYPDTHADYAVRAMKAGAHVFLEKPIGCSLEEAQAVLDAAKKYDRKVVIGYILRHHPSWIRFVELAKGLGKPLVMRLNLNQQSHGAKWATHRELMRSCSPIVDCGVHYVDIMCQMTGARPVSVQAIGARLSDEIAPDMYNYGQLQVTFDDGSVGWYEAGWGPMISTNASFVKDVIGPEGSLSIMHKGGNTSDIEGHTRTDALLLHKNNQDTWIDTEDEPTHAELCEREQKFLLEAIERDLDLSEHLQCAYDSLKIVLEADRAIRQGVVCA